MNHLLALAAEQAPPELPMPWDIVPPEMLAGGAGLLLVAGALAGAAQRSLPGARRRPALPLRWRARLGLHPGPGYVGEVERWRSLGLPHARGVAKAARPSLSWADRHRPGGWPRYAVKVGTAWGWVAPRRVFADLETVIGTFAQPGRGKSAASGASIIEWDGPLVATSMKDEAIKHTIGPRSEQGQVWIWNPEQLGETYGSNLRWNPVAGCNDPKVAARRAGTMVEAQTARGLSDSDFWNDQVSMVLGGYLHAAALAGYTMADVYAWANGADNTPLTILREARGANPASRGDVEHFLEKMADRTQSSVTTTLRRTLMFMRVPEVAAAVRPGDAEFDIGGFLDGVNTLYLVSNGSDSTTQPLFSALLAEIMHTARITAADRGGRLDPPLRLELDEVANTAPVPIDRWASWARGHGIQIRFYAQTWAQLVDRYGGLADSLWSCCGMLVVYGGTNETELLERVTHLAGLVEVRDRDTYIYEQRRDGTTKRRRQKNYKEINVLTASDLRMPRHWAVVLSSDVPPVVVRTPKVWRRRDVYRWRDKVPGGILPPMPASAPEADPGIKDRIEQERQAPAAPEPQPEQAAPAPAAEERVPGEAPVVDELAKRRERQLALRRRYALDTGTGGATGPDSHKAAETAPPADAPGDSAQASAATPPPPPGPAAAPAAPTPREGSAGRAGWSGPPPRIQDAVPGPAAPGTGKGPVTGGGSGRPVERRMHPAPWLSPEQGGPRRRYLPELDDEAEPMPWDDDGGMPRAESLPPLDDEDKE